MLSVWLQISPIVETFAKLRLDLQESILLGINVSLE